MNNQNLLKVQYLMVNKYFLQLSYNREKKITTDFITPTLSPITTGLRKYFCLSKNHNLVVF